MEQGKGRLVKTTAEGNVYEAQRRPDDLEMSSRMFKANQADQDVINELKRTNPNIFPASAQQEPEPPAEEIRAVYSEAPADIKQQLEAQQSEDARAANEIRKKIGDLKNR